MEMNEPTYCEIVFEPILSRLIKPFEGVTMGWRPYLRRNSDGIPLLAMRPIGYILNRRIKEHANGFAT